jgi:hypothetical protein
MALQRPAAIGQTEFPRCFVPKSDAISLVIAKGVILPRICV